MADWMERHFSDNRQAQRTIAMVAGTILALGATVFAVAVILVAIG